MKPLAVAILLTLSLVTPGVIRASEPEISAPAVPVASGQDPAPDALVEPGTVPREAQSRDEPPVLARPDTRVFTYGEDVPHVRCIPYRVCTLLFAADETVLHLAIGDSERWQVQLFDNGPAPAIVYKPSAFNLLSNLLVETDRRFYSIELVSPSAPAGDPRTSDIAYDALAKFRYPQAWVSTVAAPKPPAPAPDATPTAPETTPRDLHFDYTFDRPLLRSHRLAWVPDIVYDDGERTYIHLPAQAHHHDLPAVLVVDDAGEPAPTDTSLAGRASDWLVVPLVAHELRLVTSTKKQTRRLTIIRHGA